jgi:hypothetical protein
VYELSPPTQTGDPWTETVLYSFQGSDDGFIAFGDLAFDKAGNLYGATLFGGGKGTTCDSLYGGQCGTVFELSPPKVNGGHWTEKVLHRFAGPAPGAQYGDGALPNGGLVLDSAGVVYGTTYYGGNNVLGQCEGGAEGTGCGIVFALVPPIEKGGQWKEKLLHMFNGKDGANSAAGVVFDASGNLYGTTFFGPPHGNGLVFELKKPSGNERSWTETVLYLFADGPDGEEPDAALTFDAIGNLYGTAYQGSYSSQYGDVFRLKPPVTNGGKWTFSVLYGFHPPNTNPGQPASKLTIDRNELYGTTQYGGTGADCNFGGCGTVFAVGP